MGLSSGALNSLIVSKLTKFDLSADPNGHTKQFIQAIAEAVVEHIKASAELDGTVANHSTVTGKVK